MHHGPYSTRINKILQPMPMVLWAHHKEIPPIYCQINCNNCRYNRRHLARPLAWLFPLPKHCMYTVCSQGTQRPTSSLKERRNKGTRRVKGRKRPITMLAGEKQRRESQSILCNLCTEDHLTHLFPRPAESQKLLAHQQPALLTNPFPHGKNMSQASTYLSVEAGSQGTPCLLIIPRP
jgi:hypothetical protein